MERWTMAQVESANREYQTHYAFPKAQLLRMTLLICLFNKKKTLAEMLNQTGECPVEMFMISGDTAYMIQWLLIWCASYCLHLVLGPSSGVVLGALS